MDNERNHMNAWEKQESVTPCGCQTLSKMPCRHVNGVYPKFLTKGEGAYVWDDAGNKYIDFPLACGPILLGHNHYAVNDAVKRQLGFATSLSLPNPLESTVAQKIIDLIPSAESVRFVKTGSEATSAAVKIARAFTGRNKILCCGYHGWHDWYNCTTPKRKGVPDDMRKLCKQIKYNNLKGFEKHMNTLTAAVIIEPYVLEKPKDGFLEKLAEMCRDNGTLLIFDEVVTGLRTPHGSAQAFFSVMPDLTCMGKAMGNGLPIGAVCGRKDVMDVLKDDCFVSSTFGGELLSLAAADAVLDFCKKNPVFDTINESGQTLKDSFNQECERLELDAKCIGYPNRTFFIFPTEEHKSLFWQECVKRGVLFGYAQFVSYSHTPDIINETCTVMRDALDIVKSHWGSPKAALEGDCAGATFRLVAAR